MRFLVGLLRLPLRRLPPAGFLLLTPLLMLSIPSALYAADSAFQWQLWEKELTASVSVGDNPYKDVIVQVRFTGPAGTTFTQDAFWQADLTNAATKRKFKVRAALPQGMWNWQVFSCIPQQDCGSVTWTPASGTIDVTRPVVNTGIKLYDRGHLRQDRFSITAHPPGAPPISWVAYSSLLYANGTPFFWAADTAWTAPPREINGETAFWTQFLNNRKSKQFTAVLIAPAVAWQPRPQDNWPGLRGANGFSFIQSTGCGLQAIPNDCSKPRRLYWEAFDAMVQQANAKDLLVAIVGVMDPVNVTDGETGFPKVENARDFARYLTARMGGNAVIFSPGFDHAANKTTADMPPMPLRTVMDEVGDAIKAASGHRRLVTAHLAGSSSCDDYADFRDDGWMTFYFFQSGHGAGSGGLPPCPGRNITTETATRAAIRRAREMPLHLTTYPGFKLPSINGEGPYDDYPSNTEPNNPYRLRQAGYLSTLSNAGGFTYGVSRIWQWYGNLSSFFGIDSVQHMQVLYNRFRNRGAMTARHAWILDQTPDPDHENKKVLAANGPATFVLAYVPKDQSAIQIKTSSLPGLNCGNIWTKRWFDARLAITRPLTCNPGPGFITILKPSCSSHPDCDFVLQLEKTGSGMASLGSGISADALVAWDELDPEDGTSAIYSSLVHPDGSEDEPALVSPSGMAFQNAPRVARSGDGFWVVWQAEDLDRSLLGVFARRIKADGQPQGEVRQINTYTEQDQRDPAVASDAQGNAFVVWWSYEQDGDLGGVYARLFNPEGIDLGPEFRVHDEGTGFQSMPQVVADFAGNFVVAWKSDESLGALGNALVVRVFRKDAVPLTEEIRLGDDETETLHLVDVQAELSGGFAVQWTQEGVDDESFTEWRQRFDSNGEALAPPEEL